jgi:predicted transcriptional regulator
MLLLISSQNLFARTKYGNNIVEKETIHWAFQKAQLFSGIPSIVPERDWDKMSIYLLSDDELSTQVCPEDPKNCHGLVGLYDTNTKDIFLREDINPDTDMLSISFLIHEMVHKLQNELRTEDQMFSTCEKLFQTELQAYNAQDAFLKSEGQFFRAGNALKFFICNQ